MKIKKNIQYLDIMIFWNENKTKEAKQTSANKKDLVELKTNDYSNNLIKVLENYEI